MTTGIVDPIISQNRKSMSLKAIMNKTIMNKTIMNKTILNKKREKNTGAPLQPSHPKNSGEKKSKERQEKISGVVSSIAGFLIWGFSPVYWKMLGHVPVFEILSHRIIWSFLFFLPLIAWGKKWNELARALTDLKVMGALVLTTLLIGANWLGYIWAVNNGHVLQTSLGYYISPLVSVFLGVFFLKERLKRFQIAAIIIAGGGVLFLAIHHGSFPWISILLAGTFGLYGMVRKIASVGPVEGLLIETLILAVPALAFLFYIQSRSEGHFLQMNAETDFLLIGSALLTGLPLLLFSVGAKRLRLSTIGFLQYLTPSCTFFLAVFVYDEPFAFAQMVTFAAIWVALAIYSVGMILSGK